MDLRGTMASVRLHLLGRFEMLTADGTSIAIGSKKLRGLLGLLGVHLGTPLSRDQISIMLWERSYQAHARASLRQGLSVLNRSVEPHAPGWLIRSGEHLSLDPTVVDVDIQRFEQDCRVEGLAALTRAAATYRGELLEDLRVSGAGFEEWLNVERRRLRNMLSDGLARLLGHHLADGDYRKATAVGRRLESLEPLCEDVHRSLMKAYARAGRRKDALEQYHRCCRLLTEHDIGAPEPETTEFFEALRTGTPALAQTAQSPPVVKAATPEQMPLEGVPTIAVLPFGGASRNPDEEALAAVLTEACVIELRRFRRFLVISSHSSLALRGTAIGVVDAAHTLGARYIVLGSIWRVGQRVQVTAQLVDAQTGGILWGESFHRQFDDLFTLQEELARGIAGAVEPETMRQERGRAARLPPRSLGAWELTLRGNDCLYRQAGTAWDDVQAQDFFRKAMASDQDHAPAYAGLAYSICLRVKEGLTDDGVRTLDQMRELAEHAVCLDDLDPWNYVVLGRVYQQLEDFKEAVAAYRESVALCPSSAKAHFGLGYGLWAVGQYDAAVAAAERAQQLSPRDPLAWIFATVKALALFYAERFHQAETAASSARRYPLANHWPSVFEAASLVHLGHRNEASHVINRAQVIKPGLSTQMVERAFPTKNALANNPLRDGLSGAGLPLG